MSELETGRRGFLVGAALIGVGAFARPSFAAAPDSYDIVLRDAAGNDYLDDRFGYEPRTNTVWISGAHVRFGSRESTPIAPDFEYDPDSRKITAPSILCHEIGDSVDIGGGRAGPNNAAPYTPPETTEPRARLVRFWGRSWVADPRPDNGEAIGWDGDSDGEDFAVCGEMTIEADGDQTATSRPGRVVLRSTRAGEYQPRNGLIVTNRQQLAAAVDGTSRAPAWTFSDLQSGFSRHQVGDGRSFINASIDGARVADFRLPTASSTGMAVAFVDEEGEDRFEAVEIGAPNSGGDGYRILRVRN